MELNEVVVWNGAAEEENFIGRDSRRFSIRLTSPDSNTDPTLVNRVSANWLTLKADERDDDNPPSPQITLIETGPDTGVFLSTSEVTIMSDFD